MLIVLSRTFRATLENLFMDIYSCAITIKINEAHLKTKKAPFVCVDEFVFLFPSLTITND